MKFIKNLLFLLLIFNIQNSNALDPKDLLGSMTNIDIKPNINKQIQSHWIKFLSNSDQEIDDSFAVPYLISPLLGAKLWEAGTIHNYYRLLPKDNSLGKLTRELFHKNQGCFLETNHPSKIGTYLNGYDIGYIIGILLTIDFNKPIIVPINDEEGYSLKQPGKIQAYLKNQIRNNEEIHKSINNLVNSLFKSFTHELTFKPIMVLQALAYRKMQNIEDLISYFDGIAQGFNYYKDNEEITVLKNGKFGISEKFNFKEILENEPGDSIKLKPFNIDNLEKFLVSQILSNYFLDLPKIATYLGSVEFGNAKYPDCMETSLRNLINIILFQNNAFDLERISNNEVKKFYEQQLPDNIENKYYHDYWSNLIGNRYFIPYNRIAIKGEENNFQFINSDYAGFVIVPNLDDLNLNEKSEITDYSLKIDDKLFNLKEITIKEGNSNSIYKKYIVIDKRNIELSNIVCYEVIPSAEAIVSILYQFLKLNKDESNKSSINKEFSLNLEQDFFKQDFVKNLFVILNKLGLRTVNTEVDLQRSFTLPLEKYTTKFNLQIDWKRHGQIYEDSVVQNKIEYNNSFNLKFSLNPFTYSILAGMPNKILKKSEVSDELIYLFDLNNNNKIIELFFTILENESVSDFIKINLIKSIHFVPNTNFVETLDKKINSLDFNINNDIKNKLLEIASLIATKAYDFPDIEMKILGLNLLRTLVTKGQIFNGYIKIAIKAVKNSHRNIRSSGLDLFKSLFDKGKGFHQAIDIARQDLENKDWQIKQLGLKLFNALVHKGKGFPQAITAATQALNNPLYDIKIYGLNLFKALFDKGKAFNEAIKIANKAIADSNFNIQRSGLDLFEELFNSLKTLLKTGKEKVFQLAIKVATKAIENESWSIQKSGLDLFKILVDKEKGFNKAIEAATKAVKNSDDHIQESGLDLFKILVDKGKGFDEAIEAALKAVKNSDDYIQKSGLDLFKDLVVKGKGFNEAIKSASHAVKNKNSHIQKSGLDLFKALFNKGQGFNEAINIARQAIENKYVGIRPLGLPLFKTLFDKGEGFNEAIEAASQAVDTPNYNIRSSGLDLFKILVDKGEGLNEAIEAASQAVKNKNSHIQKSGLDLFKDLVVKGKGFNEAVEAAKQVSQNKDQIIRISGLNLFKVLVDQGEGLNEAIEAASQAIENKGWRIQQSGLNLLTILVKNNKISKEILEGIQSKIDDKDKRLKKQISKLLKQLEKEND